MQLIDLTPRKVCNRCKRLRPADQFKLPTGVIIKTCMACRPVVLKTRSGQSYVKKEKAQCRKCGCTNMKHCFNCHGPNTKCFWVNAAENLCSRCAGVTLHLPPGHARQIQTGGDE